MLDSDQEPSYNLMKLMKDMVDDSTHLLSKLRIMQCIHLNCRYVAKLILNYLETQYL